MDSVVLVNDEMSWTCVYLNVKILKFPVTDIARRNDWLYVLKYFFDKGLVFRCVRPTYQFLLPDLKEKESNNGSGRNGRPRS